MEKGLAYFWLITLFFIGLCIGSFLNVVIYRLPRGESIALDRSHCPVCGETLAWYDLIPVFSDFLLLGRCRACGVPISPRYLLVELLAGVITAVLFFYFGATAVFVKYLFLCLLLMVVFFIDLEHYIIPNSLVIIGLIGGVVLNAAAGNVGFTSALIGMLVTSGFLLIVALVSKGGIGGGDIKLAAVTGLFLGWPLGPLGMFLGILTAGILAIFLLLLKMKGRKDPIPFGPFIVLGTIIAAFYGNQIIHWYLYNFIKI
jgi:leader peptidase (prepilin peptidase)/N-methyltransferase